MQSGAVQQEYKKTERRLKMELSTVKKVFRIALISGWQETFALRDLLGDENFTLTKFCGTGQIEIHVSSNLIALEINDYFNEKKKEEENKGEFGYYSFLYKEAQDLIKLFENTFEFKASLIFDNIINKLQNGCKIKVLNKKRHVEIKGDKVKYIKKRIRKALKSKEKQAVFQIVY